MCLHCFIFALFARPQIQYLCPYLNTYVSPHSPHDSLKKKSHDKPKKKNWNKTRYEPRKINKWSESQTKSTQAKLTFLFLSIFCGFFFFWGFWVGISRGGAALKPLLLSHQAPQHPISNLWKCVGNPLIEIFEFGSSEDPLRSCFFQVSLFPECWQTK